MATEPASCMGPSCGRLPGGLLAGHFCASLPVLSQQQPQHQSNREHLPAHQQGPPAHDSLADAVQRFREYRSVHDEPLRPPHQGPKAHDSSLHFGGTVVQQYTSTAVHSGGTAVQQYCSSFSHHDSSLRSSSNSSCGDFAFHACTQAASRLPCSPHPNEGDAQQGEAPLQQQQQRQQGEVGCRPSLQQQQPTYGARVTASCTLRTRTHATQSSHLNPMLRPHTSLGSLGYSSARCLMMTDEEEEEEEEEEEDEEEGGGDEDGGCGFREASIHPVVTAAPSAAVDGDEDEDDDMDGGSDMGGARDQSLEDGVLGPQQQRTDLDLHPRDQSEDGRLRQQRAQQLQYYHAYSAPPRHVDLGSPAALRHANRLLAQFELPGRASV